MKEVYPMLKKMKTKAVFVAVSQMDITNDF